jgi:hypothetical protein
MKAMTMRGAVEFLRARRQQQKSGLAGSGKRASMGRCAAVSFAAAAAVAVLTGLLGAFGGDAVAGVFPAWSESPVAAAARNFVLGLGLSVFVYPFLSFRVEQTRGQKSSFGLYLGEATGRLAELGHSGAAKRSDPVVLGIDDACQNIAVSGGIGASKTTRVMYPALLQLLDQDTGGFICDVKASFKFAVAEAAAAIGPAAQDRIETIGPGHTRMNLLKGLSPEMAASNIKSALLLTGKVGDDPIWINTAGDWCRSGLGVLYYMPDRYTLGDLYHYLFDDQFAAEVIAQAQVVRDRLPAGERAVLQSYIDYRDNVWARFDGKFIGGVRATVSQVLAPFTHPKLIEAFCSEPPSGEGVEFDRILGGKVLLVDLPIKRWGIGAKVAYTFLKLRFFNLMQDRPVSRTARPVFFMCDEYQNLISANKDGLSDLDFWDKARESRCIGIVSFQGLSSVYAALGDRDLALAILQNFRQRIYFRSEDTHTLDQLGQLFGRVEIERESRSEGQSSVQGRTSHSESSSRSQAEKSLIDAQLVRGLAPEEAIGVLSIGGRATDDVVRLRQVYLEAGDDDAISAAIVPVELPQPIVPPPSNEPKPWELPAATTQETELDASTAAAVEFAIGDDDEPKSTLPDFDFETLTKDLPAETAPPKKARTKKKAVQTSARPPRKKKAVAKEEEVAPAPTAAASATAATQVPQLWVYGVKGATKLQIRAGAIAAEQLLRSRGVTAEAAYVAWQANQNGTEHDATAAQAWSDAQAVAIQTTWQLAGDASKQPPSSASLDFSEIRYGKTLVAGR